MFNESSRQELQAGLRQRIAQDRPILDELCAEVRPLKGKVTTIQPRPAQSVAVMAADSGSKRFTFDPFSLQVIRVVDSNNKTHSLDVISPTMEPAALLATHIDADGKPRSPLGRMMVRLGVKTLHELNSTIPAVLDREKLSLGWVSMYRELLEWAALLDLAEKNWGGETILIFDGLLRTKKFNSDLFLKYRGLLEGALDRHRKENGINVYVVGLSQDNQVLTRYRLALAIEGIFDTPRCYLEIPRDLENKSYQWKEWARGDDVREGGELNKFVGGKLFFAKFGKGPQDPIWPIDIIQPQIGQHAVIMGCLFNDTIDGFPVLNYPRALQKAAENAAIADFELEIVEHETFKQIRESLGTQGHHLDGLRFNT